MKKAGAGNQIAQMAAILATLETLRSRRAKAMRKLKDASDGADFNENLRYVNEIVAEVERLRNQLLSLTDEIQ